MDLSVTIPLLTVITATWFFIVVTFLCGGSTWPCSFAGRRPENGNSFSLGVGLATSCLAGTGQHT